MGNVCLQKRDSIVDPVTGLTLRDKKIIKKSWAKVMQKNGFKDNSTIFFITLFSKHPYLLDHFTIFSNIRTSTLNSNSMLHAHAISVFFAISAYVHTLNDPDTLSALLYKSAYRHEELSVTYYDMENLKEVFLEFIKDFVGPDTAEGVEAWNRFFTVHNQAFKRASDEKLHTGLTEPETSMSGLSEGRNASSLTYRSHDNSIY